MSKFPYDIRQRMGIALNVAKHIPNAVILRTMGKYEPGTGMSTSAGQLGKIIKARFGDLDSIGPYLQLLLKAGFIRHPQEILPDTMSGKGQYFITREGDRYGKALTGFAVNYVAVTGISLTEIFGVTISSLDIAAYKRYKILEDLVLANLCGEEHLRKTHISRDIGYRGIDHDLNALTNSRLIAYDIKDGVEELIIKEANYTGSVKKLDELDPDTRIVARVMIGGAHNINDICRRTRFKNKKVLDILHTLHDLNLISATSSFINRRKVEISLTEKGESLWDDFLMPLEEILSSDITDIKGKNEPSDWSLEEAMRIYTNAITKVQVSE